MVFDQKAAKTLGLAPPLTVLDHANRHVRCGSKTTCRGGRRTSLYSRKRTVPVCEYMS
jgi:hypothetical protein